MNRELARTKAAGSIRIEEALLTRLRRQPRFGPPGEAI
jgi:hypothetical protein